MKDLRGARGEDPGGLPPPFILPKILGFHLTSRVFPYLGIRHVGAPRA